MTGGALHIEPGLWLNNPETTEPKANASIARLATIPHGNAVCTMGFVQEVVPDGSPTIPPANTTLFPIGGKPPAPGAPNLLEEFNLGIPCDFRSTPVPASITQAIIDDPNTVLRTALAGQTLTHITRLITSTASPGSGRQHPIYNRQR